MLGNSRRGWLYPSRARLPQGLPRGRMRLKCPWLSSRSVWEVPGSTGQGAPVMSVALTLPCSLNALNGVDLAAVQEINMALSIR